MCKIIKVDLDFTKNKMRKNGLASWCKPCKKQYDIKRMSKPENQERRRMAYREYYKDHKDVIRPAQLLYKKSRPNKRKADKLRQYWPELKPDERIKKYEEMFTQQNGLCKLCNKPEKSLNGNTKQIQLLSVDHNHITGKVRGLLCASCNLGVGLLKIDNGIEIVYNLLNYLKGELE